MKNYKKYIFILIALTIISGMAHAQNMAFVFNGESSYLSNDVNPGLYITASDKISVEAWVYLIRDHEGNKIPILSGVDGSLEIFSLSIQDGEASFTVNGNQISTNNDGIAIFQWVHIAGTFDGETTKIYITVKRSMRQLFNLYLSGPPKMMMVFI